MYQKIKLAVIGCGAVFEKNHLNALSNSLFWEITFLVDTDENLLKKHASQLKCGYSTSLNDIPHSIEACLIATPNFLHAKQSIELINKGYHVICEKPMTITLAEAEEVKRNLVKNSGRFFIVHPRRFQKNIEYFKNNYLVNTTIKNVEISLGGKFNWVSKTDFYTSPEKAGGGVILDIGVHLLDILVSLWKPITFTRVEMSTPVKTNPVIDSAVTCFGLIGDNIPFTLRASRTAVLNSSIRIITNKGEIEISLNNTFQFNISNIETDSQKKIELQIGEFEDTFIPFWDSVAEDILGKSPSRSVYPSTIDDGLAVMSCIETSSKIADLILI